MSRPRSAGATRVGSQVGAEKQAAAKIGLSHEEWSRLRAAGLRWCYECRQWKPITDFVSDASRGGRAASACRPCGNRKALRSTYQITEAELAALPGADGRCPICQRIGERQQVDHNHDTRKVRGLLCRRCNAGLGFFLDSLDMLARARAYLEQNDG